MRRATDEARGYYYPRLYGCRGVSCFGLHVGAFATELFAGVAPQSRDDVLLDATLTITTGGLATGLVGGTGSLRGAARTAGTSQRGKRLLKRFHEDESGAVGLPEKWSKRRRLREAGPGTEVGLPGGKNKSGPFRFRPRNDYNPENPLPTGPSNGYVDRFGNEWVRGPYHGDPNLDFQFEWDVRLTNEGARHWNKYGDATRRQDGGLYINVRPDGYLSH